MAAAGTLADDELSCPLCGYDLRGLPTQRCPECGHAFDPQQLRLAKLEQREWFFEHATRRHLRSFVATTFMSLRPIKFWTVVAAAHQIAPLRLIIWSIAWVSAALAIVAAAVAAVIAQQALSPPLPTSMVLVRPYWVPAPPPPMLVDSWYGSALELYEARDLYAPLLTLALALVWPLLAIFTLQLFGSTLRTRGIHAGHLWRCTLYAMPLMVIPSASFFALCCYVDRAVLENSTRVVFDELPKFVPQMIDLLELSRAGALVLAWCALISTVHLAAAHVRYLRLPHAIAQALLVQTVVWLLMVVLMVFGSDAV